jgi:hypothetical protein
MQISAANLMIAAQQPTRAAVATEVKTKFATELPGGAKLDAAPFEPIEFKASSSPATTASATAPAPANSYGGDARLGANIDIRV